MMQQFAPEGMAAIMIADGLAELLANSSRVMVMANRRCVAMLLEEEPARPDAEARIAVLIGGACEKEAAQK